MLRAKVQGCIEGFRRKGLWLMGLGCVELNEVYVTQDSSVEAMLDDCCSHGSSKQTFEVG